MWQAHTVSKCCWKNCTDLFVWLRVATNLQFVKNATSVKQNKAKCDKTSYACTGLGSIHDIILSWSSLWRQGKVLSHMRLFVIPWTVACRAPPSLGFSWQEHWSGLPFPSSWPGDRTKVSCIVGRRFYLLSHRGSPSLVALYSNTGIFWSYWLLGLQCMHFKRTDPVH